MNPYKYEEVGGVVHEVSRVLVNAARRYGDTYVNTSCVMRVTVESLHSRPTPTTCIECVVGALRRREVRLL